MDILSHDAFIYSQEILKDIIKAEKSYIVSLSSMLKAIKRGYPHGLGAEKHCLRGAVA